jgi:hypothetical protein
VAVPHDFPGSARRPSLTLHYLAPLRGEVGRQVVPSALDHVASGMSVMVRLHLRRGPSPDVEEIRWRSEVATEDDGIGDVVIGSVDLPVRV